MAKLISKQKLDIQELSYDDGGYGIRINGNDYVLMGFDAQDVYKLLEECLNGNSDLYDKAQAFIRKNQ